MFFSIQIDIYDTFEDLLLSCDENDTPPTTGCLAFVRDTRFIYIQLSEEDCEWIPWVSGTESGQVWHVFFLQEGPMKPHGPPGPEGDPVSSSTL